MPHSLSRILVHLVFSTKGRAPILPNSLRSNLYAYIGGIIAHRGGKLLAAGAMPDHLHLLLAHPRTCSPADLVRDIKVGSTHWIREQRVPIQSTDSFAWQAGYGIFSISPSHIPDLITYINGQDAHHTTCTFQEEYRKLLDAYGIEFDEERMWD